MIFRKSIVFALILQFPLAVVVNINPKEMKNKDY